MKYILLFLVSIAFAREHSSFVSHSWNGGGRGVEQGLGGLYSNPAGLYFLNGPEAEAGANRTSDVWSTNAQYGVPVGQRSALAVGVKGFDIPNFHRKDIQAAFSLRPFPQLSFGIMALGQQFEKELEMDFNAGLQFAWRPWLAFGADIRNAAEGRRFSPYEVDTKRFWGVGLKAHPLYWHKGIGTRFSWFLDGVVSVLDSSYLQSGLSLNIGPTNNIQLLGSTDIYKYKSPVIHAGILVQERFLSHLLKLQYSIGNISKDEKNNLSHYISLGFSLNPFVDRTPPKVSVTVDRALLELNKATAPQEIFFKLRAEDNTKRIKSWHLVLSATDSKWNPIDIARSFSGQGLPPKVIRWDGKNTAKQKLPPGMYSYRLLVYDQKNNLSVTRWQLLEIR